MAVGINADVGGDLHRLAAEHFGVFLVFIEGAGCRQGVIAAGADGHDIVFQLPFVHDGIRGIADFLRRVDDPDTGTFTYEPVDAKLARKEAKSGHVLQLCFYAEAIEASTGVLPESVHIELGSGRVDPVRVADVLPYWRRLRGQLAKLLTGPCFCLG